MDFFLGDVFIQLRLDFVQFELALDTVSNVEQLSRDRVLEDHRRTIRNIVPSNLLILVSNDQIH